MSSIVYFDYLGECLAFLTSASSLSCTSLRSYLISALYWKRTGRVHILLLLLLLPMVTYFHPKANPQQPKDNTTTMDSPLPDASALEAGILEDTRPSRLSRVQDNVRNLLRSSVFGSVASSPTTSTHQQLPLSPERSTAELLPQPPVRYEIRGGQVLPSRNASPSPTFREPCPPLAATVQQRSEQGTHQSTLFNSRAVAAINHPDLSDPSMESLSLQKTRSRQQHGWTKRTKHRRTAKKVVGSRGLLVVLAAVLLAGLVATCKTTLLLSRTESLS